MSSDTQISARTERMLMTFREAHDGHSGKEEAMRKTCPFCQIIVEEQTRAVYPHIEAALRPAARAAWKHWEVNGYPIANASSFEEFLGDMVHAAFMSWAQPQYVHDVDLSDEELLEHPYVRQKIRE